MRLPALAAVPAPRAAMRRHPAEQRDELASLQGCPSSGFERTLSHRCARTPLCITERADVADGSTSAVSLTPSAPPTEADRTRSIGRKPRTVCQSQKSSLCFNGVFGGRKIGKPFDDKGYYCSLGSASKINKLYNRSISPGQS